MTLKLGAERVIGGMARRVSCCDGIVFAIDLEPRVCVS